jgi:uncharacterized protein (TIGR02145 family)
MLSPRLTNCPECVNIPSLLRKIDCKLAELGNNLYNNISYMLNKPIPAGEILQLITYRRILTHKYCNPDYVHEYSVSMIASRVIRITVGCVSRCNTPEPCIEIPCDIIIVPNPTTSTTSSTTSTSSSSTTTSTTTANPTTTTTTTTVNPCPDCISGTEVTIGAQIWTVCNLGVTTYANGDPIPEVTDPTAWEALTTGAWCYYENSTVNGTTYGKLYNWYAVNDSRGLAPLGYHVPTDAEWTTLTTYLGGESVAGGKMKSTGTSLWTNPNTNATNESCFTGLPGGVRNINGEFNSIGSNGTWWSSSENPATNAWFRYLNYNNGNASRYNLNKDYGFSVRLIKD